MKNKTISILVESDLYDFVKSQAEAESRSMGNWIKRLIEFKRDMSPTRPVPTDYSQLAPALAGKGGMGE
jgi:negative regulator of replication initiation